MARQKPNVWVKGLKNSPKSTRTREQDLGLYLNSSGVLEPIDDSWKLIAQKGVTIDSSNKIILRGDVSADQVEFSSPAANQAQIKAAKVSISNTALTPDGVLHIASGSAGTVEASPYADELVVEADSSAAGGISILSADDNFANLYFGSPTDNVGASLSYRHQDSKITLGSNLSGGSVALASGDGSEVLTIDSTGNVLIQGNLEVRGTTTEIESTNVYMKDKNLELARQDGVSPTDENADGGGITLKGATDKTITWSNANDRWDYNQSILAPNLQVSDGGNIGSTTDSDAMSIAADGQVTFSQNQNHSGQQIVDSQTVNDLQSGASFRFDGSDDKVTVAANNHTKFPTQPEISVELWANLDASVANHGLTYGTGNLFLTIQGSKFSARNYSSSGATTHQSDWTLTSGWHHYAVTITNSTSLTFYVDGVAQGTDTCAAGLDSGANGGFDIGRGYYGSETWANGEIRQVRLHNRALSADEVRAAYSGQAVSYEHTGASQTELVADGDMSNASTWTAQTGWTINGSSSGVAVADGSNIVYIHPNSSILTNGKRYRVSLKATRTSGPGVTVSYHNGTSYVPVLTETTQDTATRTVTADFTPINSSGYLFIQSGILGESTYWAGEVDDVSLTQIGCVAEYLPTGISATKWINSSGTSGLDGTVTSATAINHEVGTITATGVVEVNNGIKFPATQVSSADPNTLDDYEVGACTLTIQDAATSPSKTASLGSFDYARIGDIVTLNGRAYNIDISEFTLFAPLYIVGFPYAGTTSRDMSGYFVGADTEDVGFNWVSTTAISLVKIDSTNHNTANLLESNCPGNISVSIFGSYKATT